MSSFTAGHTCWKHNFSVICLINNTIEPMFRFVTKLDTTTTTRIEIPIEIRIEIPIEIRSPSMNRTIVVRHKTETPSSSTIRHVVRIEIHLRPMQPLHIDVPCRIAIHSHFVRWRRITAHRKIEIPLVLTRRLQIIVPCKIGTLVLPPRRIQIVVLCKIGTWLGLLNRIWIGVLRRTRIRLLASRRPRIDALCTIGSQVNNIQIFLLFIVLFQDDSCDLHWHQVVFGLADRNAAQLMAISFCRSWNHLLLAKSKMIFVIK